MPSLQCSGGRSFQLDRTPGTAEFGNSWYEAAALAKPVALLLRAGSADFFLHCRTGKRFVRSVICRSRWGEATCDCANVVAMDSSYGNVSGARCGVGSGGFLPPSRLRCKPHFRARYPFAVRELAISVPHSG